MNRVLFSIGNITIYWYSVTMLIAVLTAIYLSIKESKKVNMYNKRYARMFFRNEQHI